MSVTALAAEVPSEFAEPTETDLKTRLLTWCDSVQSFDMRYRLRSDDIDRGERRLRGLWRFDYRRSAGNFFIREDTLDENGAFAEGMTFAFCDGNGGFLQVQDNGRSAGIVDAAEVSFPYFPPGAYITPEEILGENLGRSMREMLADGDSRVLARSGEWVLAHDNPVLKKSVEIAFDADFEVVRMDWLLKSFELTEEQIAAHWRGDPRDVRLRQTSLILHDRSPVNGVLFPHRVEKIWWNSDPVLKEELVARRNDDDMTQEAFLVEFFTRPQFESIIQTFEIEAIQLNQAMAPEDFRIDWPADAELHDDATWAQLTNPNASGGGPSWHLRLWGWCMPQFGAWTVREFSIAFAALSGALALGAGGVYARRRLRHRAGHP